jgi:hypothetical protein
MRANTNTNGKRTFKKHEINMRKREENAKKKKKNAKIGTMVDNNTCDNHETSGRILSEKNFQNWTENFIKKKKVVFFPKKKTTRAEDTVVIGVPRVITETNHKTQPRVIRKKSNKTIIIPRVTTKTRQENTESNQRNMKTSTSFTRQKCDTSVAKMMCIGSMDLFSLIISAPRRGGCRFSYHRAQTAKTDVRKNHVVVIDA